ncbi:ArsR/SmtB family transcription factor [Vallicoccus soli]|uniref:ArsR/SmtB family transcription factor n=1 Tax=Vallicoccus soli TaxID=2339232 RepID=UPI001403D2FC|nr:metalloregulator ArsR/SmtB family transcription factor [Vallicoccus soli]
MPDEQPDGRPGGDPALLAAAELFKVLSTPLRLGIVVELARAERRVQELVDALGASQPLVSQHLRHLRAAHLVRGDRQGREVVYALADEHVAHIVLDAVQHAAEDRPVAT